MVSRCFFIMTVALFCKSAVVFAQEQDKYPDNLFIRPAFSFLLLNTDSRTGGMGESGVALADDRNAMINNPAKTVFSKERENISLSYSPYLKSLSNSISLASLSGVTSLNEKSSIGGSIRYLSLGVFELTNTEKQNIGTFSPSELAIDLSYIKSFGQELSMALSARYVTSSLRSSGMISGNGNIVDGSGMAVDFHAFYRHELNISQKDALLSFGFGITNLGPKVSYNQTLKQYLPANLKLGSSLSLELDPVSRLTCSIDFSKLLVPSPGNPSEETVEQSVPASVFSSFADAGGGFKEELQEVAIATGLEYTIKNRFSLRCGYFYENPHKGYRRYLTFGTGLIIGKIGLDIGYIAAGLVNSPMANSLRFTAAYSF